MDGLVIISSNMIFLLTPLREGRRIQELTVITFHLNFYSRPCGRGDNVRDVNEIDMKYFYSRPCGRGDYQSAAIGY